MNNNICPECGCEETFIDFRQFWERCADCLHGIKSLRHDYDIELKNHQRGLNNEN